LEKLPSEIYFFFLLLGITVCLGGHDKADHGARSAAMAGADVGLTGFWSLRNNQAGLSHLEAPAAGLFYENRFGIRALGLQSIGFAYPFKTGTIGVTANYFGDRSYNESAFGLAYGMKIFEDLSVGVQLDYFASYTDAETFVKNNAVTFEGGVLYDLTKDITVGLHAYNPLEIKMEQSDAVAIIPSSYSIGVVVHITEGILVSSELLKTMNQKESVRLGVEYEIIEKTFLRTGVATHPGLFSFGFETSWNRWTLQLASSMHQVLGFSPMISILTTF
jgi:hypothetical protein